MPSLTMIPSTQADAAALYSMSMDDIADRLTVMQHQESTSYRGIDYLQLMHQHQDDINIDIDNLNIMEHQQQHVEARSKMCVWCLQLTDICKLSRHAVSRSMNYLDRYIAASMIANNDYNASSAQSHHLLDKRQYQLAAMTCLYISIKLHEPLAMDASLLAEISAGCYTTSEILAMESHILNVLEWKVNGPTVQEYIVYMLGLCNPEWYGYDLTTLRELLDASRFQCELAICDYELSIHCPASVVAVSCILNALEGVEEGCMSCQARFDYMARLWSSLVLLGKDCNDCCSSHGGMDSSTSTIRRMTSLIQVRLRKLYCQNSGEEMVVRMRMTTAAADSQQGVVSESEDTAQVCTRVVSPRRSSAMSCCSTSRLACQDQHKVVIEQSSTSSFLYSQVKCSSPVVFVK